MAHKRRSKARPEPETYMIKAARSAPAAFAPHEDSGYRRRAPAKASALDSGTAAVCTSNRSVG